MVLDDIFTEIERMNEGGFERASSNYKEMMDHITPLFTTEFFELVQALTFCREYAYCMKEVSTDEEGERFAKSYSILLSQIFKKHSELIKSLSACPEFHLRVI